MTDKKLNGIFFSQYLYTSLLQYTQVKSDIKRKLFIYHNKQQNLTKNYMKNHNVIKSIFVGYLLLLLLLPYHHPDLNPVRYSCMLLEKRIPKALTCIQASTPHPPIQGRDVTTHKM